MTFSAQQLAAANRTLGIARDCAIEALITRQDQVAAAFKDGLLISALESAALHLGYRLEPVRREDDEGSD